MWIELYIQKYRYITLLFSFWLKTNDFADYKYSVTAFSRKLNCRKGEVIRETNYCNLQRNVVALQVEKRCRTYFVMF